MILPAMACVGHHRVFRPQPLFGYKPMVYSIAGIAGLASIVWGHHMFVSGMSPVLGMTFMSRRCSSPCERHQGFNWLGTIWGARIQFTTPMLFALSFVSMFIIGGLSGISWPPRDRHLHSRHIFHRRPLHYVLFSARQWPYSGDLFLVPQDVWPMMNDSWGKLHFTLTFILLNCVFYRCTSWAWLASRAGWLTVSLRDVQAPVAAQSVSCRFARS